MSLESSSAVPPWSLLRPADSDYLTWVSTRAIEWARQSYRDYLEHAEFVSEILSGLEIISRLRSGSH